jgi:hypothetical protein
MKNVTTVVALAAAATAASAIDLTHLKTVDISSFSASSTAANWIGSNPSAIAWNGTDLFVGGYNASGATATTALNKVSNLGNAHSLGSSSFGSLTTVNSRGITGLAIKGDSLGAAFDNGTPNVNALRMFSASGATQTWATGGPTPDASRRGMGGTAFDPGFNGAGTNVGISFLFSGSGRRHLLAEGNGAYINGQNAGAIVNFNPAQTTWRDHAYNPVTGDLFTRESNRVGKAIRSGDNSFTTVSGGQSAVIYSTTVNSNIDNQNIAFINSGTQGNFVIINDRSATGAGQAFTSVIRILDLNGNVQTINFTNAFNPAAGNGAYDFSFNAATNTLAVSDFANRRVYLFGIPTPGVLGVLGAFGAVAGRRRRN